MRYALLNYAVINACFGQICIHLVEFAVRYLIPCT